MHVALCLDDGGIGRGSPGKRTTISSRWFILAYFYIPKINLEEDAGLFDLSLVCLFKLNESKGSVFGCFVIS